MTLEIQMVMANMILPKGYLRIEEFFFKVSHIIGIHYVGNSHKFPFGYTSKHIGKDKKYLGHKDKVDSVKYAT